MSDIAERLWTPDDLGLFMGLSPRTIVTLASRAPDRLPARVKAISPLRWVPDVARAWAIAQSANGKPKNRGGRPRG